MTIPIIIIIVAFIYTIIDKFFLKDTKSSKPNDKRTLWYKFIKSKYTLIFLLIILLVFQIISECSSDKASRIRDTKAFNAYDTLYVAHNNLKNINSSVESLFYSIDSTLDITKKQLNMISELNFELENVRKDIYTSVQEFNSIREQYEKQIELEKEKIKEARPLIEVSYVKQHIDSVHFSYSFELLNSGIRMADSITYHSLLILVDSTFQMIETYLYKTNIDEANVLSISNTEKVPGKIFNSSKIEKSKLKSVYKAYILLSYKYTDNMTGVFEDSFHIFGSSFLEQSNQQFGINIKNIEKEIIKKHLLNSNKKLYGYFYK